MALGGNTIPPTQSDTQTNINGHISDYEVVDKEEAMSEDNSSKKDIDKKKKGKKNEESRTSFSSGVSEISLIMQEVTEDQFEKAIEALEHVTSAINLSGVLQSKIKGALGISTGMKGDNEDKVTIMTRESVELGQDFKDKYAIKNSDGEWELDSSKMFDGENNDLLEELLHEPDNLSIKELTVAVKGLTNKAEEIFESLGGKSMLGDSMFDNLGELDVRNSGKLDLYDTKTAQQNFRDDGLVWENDTLHDKEGNFVAETVTEGRKNKTAKVELDHNTLGAANSALTSFDNKLTYMKDSVKTMSETISLKMQQTQKDQNLINDIAREGLRLVMEVQDQILTMGF